MKKKTSTDLIDSCFTEVAVRDTWVLSYLFVTFILASARLKEKPFDHYIKHGGNLPKYFGFVYL